jgi:hypothetical protein
MATAAVTMSEVRQAGSFERRMKKRRVDRKKKRNSTSRTQISLLNRFETFIKSPNHSIIKHIQENKRERPRDRSKVPP